MAIDPWSLKAVRLKILFDDKEVGSATGFFWKSNLRVWLITNWHVLSGCHPYNHELLSPGGTIPNAVLYPRYYGPTHSEDVVYEKADLRDTTGNNIWLEHPTHGSLADVAALEVPFLIPIYGKSGGNSRVHPVMAVGTYLGWDLLKGMPPWHGPHRSMGEELFVLGFPLGVTPTAHYPIWKRASVATEMDVPLAGLPAFLIDSATREGMSGSPVVHLERVGVLNSRSNRKITFQGVYAGRQVRRDLDEAALGVVWREEVIHNIVANQKTGYIDFNRRNLNNFDYLKVSL